MCTTLWRESDSELNIVKNWQVQGTFGSSSPPNLQLWDGAGTIWKSKSLKTGGVGTLFEIQVPRICTTLWRESDWHTNGSTLECSASDSPGRHSKGINALAYEIDGMFLKQGTESKLTSNSNKQSIFCTLFFQLRTTNLYDCQCQHAFCTRSGQAHRQS